MKRIGLILLAGFIFLPVSSRVYAQQDDPSEVFLKAYMASQQGEKLERENQFKNALAKYRFAGSLIEELRKSHADWQPAIVEYRGRKISEGILRIQDKVSTQNDLASEPAQGPGRIEGGVEVVTSDVAVKEATKKLRGKVDQLQSALDKSRSDLDTARKEKELVDARLKETSSKLEKAQNEIEKSKKSERDLRDQLTHAQDSLKTLQASRDSGSKEQQQLRSEVARLKDAVTAKEEARVTAEKQRDEANRKVADANKQIAALTQARDEAVAQARSNPPGLVLADIQLADDSSGIDAVKDILAEFAVPVIFITAFPERLLTGERPEPTFLITKPFQRSTVKAAIAQALFFDAATVPAA